MPTFTRTTEHQVPGAVVVHIHQIGDATLGRLSWPALAKPSSIVGATVIGSLVAEQALEAATDALEAGIVSDVLIRIDHPKLWLKHWGELK